MQAALLCRPFVAQAHRDVLPPLPPLPRRPALHEAATAAAERLSAASARSPRSPEQGQARGEAVMSTILRAARRSAFLAGVGTAAALYVYTRTHFWRLTEETAQQLPGAVPRQPAPAAAAPEAPEATLSETARVWTARRWNESVDAVFKPVVDALSSRNL